MLHVQILHHQVSKHSQAGDNSRWAAPLSCVFCLDGLFGENYNNIHFGQLVLYV
jgi:hypothetical protein